MFLLSCSVIDNKYEPIVDITIMNLQSLLLSQQLACTILSTATRYHQQSGGGVASLGFNISS
jgi:hypothetical protein